MSATETTTASYEELEQAVLDHYGIEATHHHLALKRPDITGHVLEYGRGVPAILMHGGDGEGWNFAPLMAELAGDLRMFAIDRPGYGRSGYLDYSEVPDLRAHAVDYLASLMDGLGLESAVLVASSFSGIFALPFALAHPERVRAIVIPSYAAGVSRYAAWGIRVRATFPRFGRGYTEAGRTPEGQENLHRNLWGIPPGGLPDVFYQARSAGSQLPGCEKNWQYLRSRIIGLRGTRPEACYEDELKRIERPVLVLWGDDERNAVGPFRKATSTLPDCRFVVLPDVGHFPHMQAPTRTARYIREFLHSVPAA
ncbi:alpha/beta hydrolase [Nonomuraea sp. NPDC005650]|uniref:alpha/beta fold hydrolase n=1 Tax=Nonomuraea sp. NPDC005650 TaxID=3157045 RepID=UPI0033AF357A